MPGLANDPGAPRNGGHRPGLADCHPVGRYWHRVVDGLAALGTLLIGVLMVIICADILARNLLGGSLPLVSEIGALTLVMIVYLQLAATVRAGRLPRTEVLLVMLQKSRPWVGCVLAAAFDLVGAVMVGLIAWSTVHILGKDFASYEFIGVSGIATLPTWPFRALILVGVTVAAAEFVARAVVALRAAAGGRG